MLDECLGGFPAAGDELDVELLDPARQDADGRDLRVVDVDYFTVERAKLRPAQREVLDDPLNLQHRDRDRVADGVPALDEHVEAGDDVHEHSLRGEADEDEDERGAGHCGQAAEPPSQLGSRQHKGGRERDVGDAGPDHRDAGLAPLEFDDLGAQVSARGPVPAIGPGHDLPSDDGAQAGHGPGGREQEDDGEGVEHLLQPLLPSKVSTGI